MAAEKKNILCEETYLLFNCRCICNFLSICSIGNWETSYGADISLGSMTASPSIVVMGEGDDSPRKSLQFFLIFSMENQLGNLDRKIEVEYSANVWIV